MDKSRLHKRYAEAFFSVIEEKDLEACYADFQAFVEIYEKHEELRNILENPAIEIERKLDFVKKVFADKLQEDVFNFIFLLINQKRIYLLSQTADIVDKFYREKHGIRGIKVKTVIPLTKEERNRLETILTKKFGKIEIKEVIDPDLLGGLIIQLDDQVVDESIRVKLHLLRETMDRVDKNWMQLIIEQPSLAI